MSTSFDSEVRIYYSETIAAVADGITVEEVGQIVRGFIKLCVSAATRLNLTGPEKKAWVLNWVSALIEKITPSLPFPWNWLVYFGKAFVLRLVNGAIESHYQTDVKQIAPTVPPPVN